MSEYSQILNLDLERLKTLSDVYFGYAEALTKMENEYYYPDIASCYTISAIYKSILSPGNGTEAFIRAAKFYEHEKNDYWVVCSICANDTSRVLRFYERNREKDSEIRSSILENILASAFIDENINQQSIFFDSSIPLGRLNIPSKTYTDALRDVSALTRNENNEKSSFDNILLFLRRASESVYTLKEDSFHWINLYGNFLPLEPEILGHCIVICKKIKELNFSINSIFEQGQIAPIIKLPLQIADKIINRDDFKLR